MSRNFSWTGFNIYIMIQEVFIIVKLMSLFTFSWWFVFLPTIVVFLGGLYFVIWFGLTCNPRIERDIDIEVTK